MGKKLSSTLIKLKSFIRYFFFFSNKMKISYSCLIVAVVIGLGTVTAAPAGDVKAAAEDAAKLADSEYDYDSGNCADCPKCAKSCPNGCSNQKYFAYQKNFAKNGAGFAASTATNTADRRRKTNWL